MRTPIILAGLVLLLATLADAQAPRKSNADGIPRLPDGKPDLSGVWERPPVLDMSKSGPNQQGAGELPFTAWAKQNLIEETDASGHCLPLGYTRNINSPFLMEIVQRSNRVVLLYEQQNIFHVIFTDGRGHPKDLEPLWAGHSIGKWEGDTLVVDTVGFNEKTRLDNAAHPHTGALHVVERFTRTDSTHMTYEVTIEDPKAYTRAWKNVRTFTLRPDWELMEYSCEENNRDVEEKHIK